MKLLTKIKSKFKQLLQKEKKPEYGIMQYVYSDKRRIDGSSTISFFVNNSETEISVTRTFESEDETVNWLMANCDFRRMLLGNLFPASTSVKHYCAVKEPITIPNKMPGDIDILLYEKGNEENAVGIECKIVKSESRENKPIKINKITSVQKKGTIQANGYSETGFSRVYIGDIIRRWTSL